MEKLDGEDIPMKGRRLATDLDKIYVDCYLDDNFREDAMPKLAHGQHSVIVKDADEKGAWIQMWVYVPNREG